MNDQHHSSWALWEDTDMPVPLLRAALHHPVLCPTDTAHNQVLHGCFQPLLTLPERPGAQRGRQQLMLVLLHGEGWSPKHPKVSDFQQSQLLTTYLRSLKHAQCIELWIATRKPLTSIWFNQENTDYKIYSTCSSLERTLPTTHRNFTICTDMHFSTEDSLHSSIVRKESSV